jgi:uncharacterized membrane protein YfcA
MDTSTLLILLLIGFAAGLLGGFVGIGGGIIIVPALVYFLGLTEHQAIGTSIAVASAFVLGGYFGSKMSLALKDSVHIVKLVFGSVMLYAALRMIWAAVKVMIAK